MNFWGTLVVQGIEEMRNLPSGGELRGRLEGVFGHQKHSTYKIDSPGGLWAHPPMVGYAFLQYLALQGGPRNSPVWTTLAQNGQKALKRGVTPLQIRATLLLLFSINLARKRCLY